jgi:hypothetical protein
LPCTAGSLDSRRSVARLLLEVLSKTEALVTVENRKKQAITTQGCCASLVDAMTVVYRLPPEELLPC